jgi:hypothetical protein
MKTSKNQDANQTAFRVVQAATGQTAAEGKDPAAVALGRRGGLKGGPARAKKLSKERRAEIAKKAAKKRWKGHKKAKRKPE